VQQEPSRRLGWPVFFLVPLLYRQVQSSNAAASAARRTREKWLRGVPLPDKDPRVVVPPDVILVALRHRRSAPFVLFRSVAPTKPSFTPRTAAALGWVWRALSVYKLPDIIKADARERRCSLLATVTCYSHRCAPAVLSARIRSPSEDFRKS